MSSRKWKLLKTISWSSLAFSITAVVVFAMTGSIAKGGGAALICRVIKIFAYYYHESWWERLKKQSTVKTEEFPRIWEPVAKQKLGS